MHAALFSLVPVGSPEAVFGWGMEIITYDGQEEAEPNRQAVVYIGLAGGKGNVAMHDSAEAACTRWSRVVPLDLVWDADLWADARQHEPTRTTN